MSNSSRRKFLIMAGSGAATAAVAAAVAPQASARPADRTSLPEDAPETLVAYVGDIRSGEVILMVGDQEVVVSDHELVARLARAAR
jgi:photosystem II stability/assembly factor-like uncharacterized protein